MLCFLIASGNSQIATLAMSHEKLAFCKSSKRSIMPTKAVRLCEPQRSLSAQREAVMQRRVKKNNKRSLDLARVLIMAGIFMIGPVHCSF